MLPPCLRRSGRCLSYADKHRQLCRIRSKYDHYKRLWKDWMVHVGHVKGWGAYSPRDKDAQALQADEDVEEDHYLMHGRCTKFQRKLPQWHSQCAELFEEKLAVGHYAVTARDVADLDTSSEEVEGEDEYAIRPRDRRTLTAPATPNTTSSGAFSVRRHGVTQKPSTVTTFATIADDFSQTSCTGLNVTRSSVRRRSNGTRVS